MRSVLLALPFFLLVHPALATSPAAQAGADRATPRACGSVSGLRDATIEGAPVRLSDTIGIDARLVRGTWPQPHMKATKATMLCLYDRKAKRGETQEWPAVTN